MRRFRVLLLVAVGSAVVIGGVVALGRYALRDLDVSDRERLPFQEIDCDAPPGMNKKTFLEEVQYNGQFSDVLNLSDSSLPNKLKRAFQEHRRVKEVRDVRISSPKRIRVELVFE